MSDSLPDREQRWAAAWWASRHLSVAAWKPMQRLADREQAENVALIARIRAESLELTQTLIALVNATEAEAAGLRERLTRAEAAIEAVAAACDRADEAAADSPRRPDGKTWVGFLLTPSIRAALSADENGTRDE